MRNPERLDSFYEELKSIHQYNCPDLRFGQFVINVFGWISDTKQKRPFYLEEEEMLRLFLEYVQVFSPRKATRANGKEDFMNPPVEVI